MAGSAERKSYSPEEAVTELMTAPIAERAQISSEKEGSVVLFEEGKELIAAGKKKLEAAKKAGDTAVGHFNEGEEAAIVQLHEAGIDMTPRERAALQAAHDQAEELRRALIAKIQEAELELNAAQEKVRLLGWFPALRNKKLKEQRLQARTELANAQEQYNDIIEESQEYEEYVDLREQFVEAERAVRENESAIKMAWKRFRAWSEGKEKSKYDIIVEDWENEDVVKEQLPEAQARVLGEVLTAKLNEELLMADAQAAEHRKEDVWLYRKYKELKKVRLTDVLTNWQPIGKLETFLANTLTIDRAIRLGLISAITIASAGSGAAVASGAQAGRRMVFGALQYDRNIDSQKEKKLQEGLKKVREAQDETGLEHLDEDELSALADYVRKWAIANQVAVSTLPEMQALQSARAASGNEVSINNNSPEAQDILDEISQIRAAAFPILVGSGAYAEGIEQLSETEAFAAAKAWIGEKLSIAAEFWKEAAENNPEVVQALLAPAEIAFDVAFGAPAYGAELPERPSSGVSIDAGVNEWLQERGAQYTFEISGNKLFLFGTGPDSEISSLAIPNADNVSVQMMNEMPTIIVEKDGNAEWAVIPVVSNPAQMESVVKQVLLESYQDELTTSDQMASRTLRHLNLSYADGALFEQGSTEPFIDIKALERIDLLDGSHPVIHAVGFDQVLHNNQAAFQMTVVTESHGNLVELVIVGTDKEELLASYKETYKAAVGTTGYSELFTPEIPIDIKAGVTEWLSAHNADYTLGESGAELIHVNGRDSIDFKVYGVERVQVVVHRDNIMFDLFRDGEHWTSVPGTAHFAETERNIQSFTSDQLGRELAEAEEHLRQTEEAQARKAEAVRLEKADAVFEWSNNEEALSFVSDPAYQVEQRMEAVRAICENAPKGRTAVLEGNGNSYEFMPLNLGRSNEKIMIRVTNLETGEQSRITVKPTAESLNAIFPAEEVEGIPDNWNMDNAVAVFMNPNADSQEALASIEEAMRYTPDTGAARVRVDVGGGNEVEFVKDSTGAIRYRIYRSGAVHQATGFAAMREPVGQHGWVTLTDNASGWDHLHSLQGDMELAGLYIEALAEVYGEDEFNPYAKATGLWEDQWGSKADRYNSGVRPGWLPRTIQRMDMWVNEAVEEIPTAVRRDELTAYRDRADDDTVFEHAGVRAGERAAEHTDDFDDYDEYVLAQDTQFLQMREVMNGWADAHQDAWIVAQDMDATVKAAHIKSFSVEKTIYHEYVDGRGRETGLSLWHVVFSEDDKGRLEIDIDYNDTLLAEREISVAKIYDLRKEQAIQEYLRPDYQEVVAAKMGERSLGAERVLSEVTDVEQRITRIAGLLEARDAMRDAGLTDTQEYQALYQELIRLRNGMRDYMIDAPPRDELVYTLMTVTNANVEVGQIQYNHVNSVAPMERLNQEELQYSDEFDDLPTDETPPWQR